jgi:hypothetical protein
MIESPLIQEIIAEAKAKAKAKQESILTILPARFGPIPAEVSTAVQAVYDLQKLTDLVIFLAQCPDLEAFRAKLPT